MLDELDNEQESALPEKRRFAPPWMTYAFVGSVGLNLLVLGVIGGLLLRGTPEKRLPPEKSVAVLGLRPYYRALSSDDRRTLLKTLRANRPAFLSGPADLRAHLTALAAALEAEPFNEKQVVAVLESQGALISEKLALGHRLLLDRLREMTPEQRLQFAKRLRNPRSHPFEKRRIKPRN